MKIFKANDGQVFQLAEKKRIQQWDSEMPILFYNYIKDKRFPTYPKEIQKDVDIYLQEILTNIAIPKLITALKSPNIAEKRNAAKNILETAKKNPNLIKNYISNIESSKSDLDPDTASKIKEILKLFQKPN